MPFLAKAIPYIIPGLGALGKLGGGGGERARSSRLEQAEIQAQINRDNNRAALDAAQFNLGAPSTRMSQVARGDLIGRMQDTPLTGDPRIDKFAGGGLRPSVFGASTRQGGGALARQALMALLQNRQFTPTVSRIPPSGKMEKFGGFLGTLGGLAGGLEESGIFPRRQRFGLGDDDMGAGG